MADEEKKKNNSVFVTVMSCKGNGMVWGQMNCEFIPRSGHCWMFYEYMGKLFSLSEQVLFSIYSTSDSSKYLLNVYCI